LTKSKPSATRTAGDLYCLLEMRERGCESAGPLTVGKGSGELGY
jgi:hypothetical protein